MLIDNASTKYVFGNCDFNKDLKLYTTVNFKVADMKHKVILRVCNCVYIHRFFTYFGFIVEKRQEQKYALNTHLAFV